MNFARSTGASQRLRTCDTSLDAPSESPVPIVTTPSPSPPDHRPPQTEEKTVLFLLLLVPIQSNPIQSVDLLLFIWQDILFMIPHRNRTD